MIGLRTTDGGVTLPMLREKIDRWIAAQQRRQH
jgi:hypothetical protein